MTLYAQLQEASAFVRERLAGRTPKVGLILGSGLGSFAETLEELFIAVAREPLSLES